MKWCIASALAEADLDDVWYYIAKQSGSVEIAGRQIAAITSRFYLLASHPATYAT